MLSKRAVVLSALIAISSTASAGSKANDEGVRDARAAIEAANVKFSEAFARGDAKALSAIYTSDAIAFPPDSEMIRGNGAICTGISGTAFLRQSDNLTAIHGAVREGA